MEPVESAEFRGRASLLETQSLEGEVIDTVTRCFHDLIFCPGALVFGGRCFMHDFYLWKRSSWDSVFAHAESES